MVLKFPSTRNSPAVWESSRSTPSISGAVRDPVNSMKNMYSQLLPGMGRDSSFTRFNPFTAKMDNISWRLPDSWGVVSTALILSAPGRSSMLGDTTTNRVVLMAL